MPSENNFHSPESRFVVVVICQKTRSNLDFDCVPLPKLALNILCWTVLSLHPIVIVNNTNYKNRSYNEVMVYDIIIKIWKNDKFFSNNGNQESKNTAYTKMW